MNDTIPKLIKDAYLRYGGAQVAVRKKYHSLWRNYSWSQYYEKIKHLALGLLDIGLAKDDKVCILGDDDIEWFVTEIAIQVCGGIAVAIHADVAASEMAYLLDKADVKFVVAKDQEQVDKVLQVHEGLPKLEKIIYWDNKGLWNYDSILLMDFQDVLRKGDDYERKHSRVFDECIDNTHSSDVALIIYTSGATGHAKASMLSHKNLISIVNEWTKLHPWPRSWNFVCNNIASTPVGQLIAAVGSPLCGIVLNFAGSSETAEADAREISPEIVIYGPRLWEHIVRSIKVRIDRSSLISRIICKLSLSLGGRIVRLQEQGKRPNFSERILHAINETLVLCQIRDKIGLKHVVYPYSFGSSLSADITRYLRSVGIPLHQLYGGVESGILTLHARNFNPETVGIPLPGNEIRIDNRGQIIARGGGVFQGYYKQNEETGEIVANGWFQTKDAGHLNESGELEFLDRVQNLEQLPGGSTFSPLLIEDKLRFSPYIQDVITLIGKQKYDIAALITIDFENASKWAEDKGILYTTQEDLALNPEICSLIKNDLEKINMSLTESLKIKKFVLLNKGFDVDEGELTSNRKLRREVIKSRYQRLIDAIYSDNDEYVFSTPVSSRNSRKSAVATKLLINKLEKS